MIKVPLSQDWRPAFRYRYEANPVLFMPCNGASLNPIHYSDYGAVQRGMYFMPVKWMTTNGSSLPSTHHGDDPFVAVEGQSLWQETPDRVTEVREWTGEA